MYKEVLEVELVFEFIPFEEMRLVKHFLNIQLKMVTICDFPSH